MRYVKNQGQQGFEGARQARNLVWPGVEEWLLIWGFRFDLGSFFGFEVYFLMIGEPRPSLFAQILRVFASFGIASKNTERLPLYTDLWV